MKRFLVLGLGRFGSSVARALSRLGHEVTGVDRDPAVVESQSAILARAVKGDATNVEILRTLSVRDFDVAVVAIGSDTEASLMATLLLKELGVHQVVAKASTDFHGRILGRIGADRIVFPERDMGLRVAYNLASANFLDFIELSPELSIVEITPPPAMVGRSLRQLDLRAKYGVNVVVMRKGGTVKVSPRADEVIEAGDVLVVIGHIDSIRGLQKMQA